MAGTDGVSGQDRALRPGIFWQERLNDLIAAPTLGRIGDMAEAAHEAWDAARDRTEAVADHPTSHERYQAWTERHDAAERAARWVPMLLDVLDRVAELQRMALRVDEMGEPIVDDRAWLVWSNRCTGWWLPNRDGYTLNPNLAGRFSKAEAGRIVTDAGPDDDDDGMPSEVAMQVPAHRCGSHIPTDPAGLAEYRSMFTVEKIRHRHAAGHDPYHDDVPTLLAEIETLNDRVARTWAAFAAAVEAAE